MNIWRVLQQSALGRNVPLSFRQILLFSFFIVVALLAGALSHTLVSIQNLTKANEQFPTQALSIANEAHEIQSLSINLERSARQYLVLFDSNSRQNLMDNLNQSKQLSYKLALESPNQLGPLINNWQDIAQHAIDRTLKTSPNSPIDSSLWQSFTELGNINTQINQATQNLLEERNQKLTQHTQDQRQILIETGITVVILTLGFSGLLGIWLSASIKQVATAIDSLGTSTSQNHPIVLGGAKDIRQLAERLEELRQRLKALEEDKEIFLRQISHELKTPLANIREGVALISEQVVGPTTPKQMEILTILKENSLDLQTRIESLLQYQSLVFQQKRQPPKPVSLDQTINSWVQRHRLLLEQQDIHFEYSSNPYWLSLTQEDLELIFGNLMTNALRFSSKGGTIKILTKIESSCLLLDCIDYGLGIAPEDKHKIFDPFYQGQRQPPTAKRGSGVGLSIVKNLLTTLGGSIELLDSQEGAHFQVRFPLQLAHPHP